MKLVINDCFGGFSLSELAYKELGIKWDGHGQEYNDKRDDKKLVSVVEKLGDDASGLCASLIVIEIPEDVIYEITDHDGAETVREKSREWS